MQRCDFCEQPAIDPVILECCHSVCRVHLIAQCHLGRQFATDTHTPADELAYFLKTGTQPNFFKDHGLEGPNLTTGTCTNIWCTGEDDSDEPTGFQCPKCVMYHYQEYLDELSSDVLYPNEDVFIPTHVCVNGEKRCDGANKYCDRCNTHYCEFHGQLHQHKRAVLCPIHGKPMNMFVKDSLRMFCELEEDDAEAVPVTPELVNEMAQMVGGQLGFLRGRVDYIHHQLEKRKATVQEQENWPFDRTISQKEHDLRIKTLMYSAVLEPEQKLQPISQTLDRVAAVYDRFLRTGVHLCMVAISPMFECMSDVEDRLSELRVIPWKPRLGPAILPAELQLKPLPVVKQTRFRVTMPNFNSLTIYADNTVFLFTSEQTMYDLSISGKVVFTDALFAAYDRECVWIVDKASSSVYWLHRFTQDAKYTNSVRIPPTSAIAVFGEHLAIASDDAVLVLDKNTGAVLNQITGCLEIEQPGEIVAISDDRFVVSCKSDKIVWLCDSRNTLAEAKFDLGESISSITFLQKENTVLVAVNSSPYLYPIDADTFCRCSNQIAVPNFDGLRFMPPSTFIILTDPDTQEWFALVREL